MQTNPLYNSWANPCTWDGKRLDFGHLGGTSSTGDPNSWFPELWDWLITQYKIQKMLDVGCGVGFAIKFFWDNKVVPLGLDCQQVLENNVLKSMTRPIDFTTHSIISPSDLVWCCEVAEHIEEDKNRLLLDTIVQSTQKVLAFSAAPVGCGGYHHVNCQNPPYWVKKIEEHSDGSLLFNEEATKKAKSLCGPYYGRSETNYFLRSGLIFEKVQNAN